MPVADIRKHYLLSEAFELIGERLYGPEWTHNELTQRKVPSPDELESARKPFVEAQNKAAADLKQIDAEINRMHSETEMEALQRKRGDAFERLDAAGMELNRIPEVHPIHHELHANYQRKGDVEAKLIGALASGALRASDGRARLIDAVLWGGHPHFGYCLEQSVVRMPRAAYGRPRFWPARIEEESFDAWLRTLKPRNPGAIAQLSPEEQCRAYLESEIAIGKRMTRDEYRDEAMRRIRNLSERKFLYVWDSTVPPDWTRAGWKKPGSAGKQKSARPPSR